MRLAAVDFILVVVVPLRIGREVICSNSVIRFFVRIYARSLLYMCTCTGMYHIFITPCYHCMPVACLATPLNGAVQILYAKTLISLVRFSFHEPCRQDKPNTYRECLSTQYSC